jgi:hypothetical protein
VDGIRVHHHESLLSHCLDFHWSESGSFKGTMQDYRSVGAMGFTSLNVSLGAGLGRAVDEGTTKGLTPRAG